MKSAYLTASILAFAAAMPAAARDQIQVTGSSTVLPYATIVAEAFGENFDFPTPVVEGGGSGRACKKLLRRRGREHHRHRQLLQPHQAQSDIDRLQGQRRDEIMEVRIGYDGIVFASDVNGADFALTPADWSTTRWPPRWSRTARWSTTPPPNGPKSARPARSGHPGLRPRHQARHPRSLRRKGDRGGLQGNRRAGPVQGHRRGRTTRKRNNAKKACLALRTDGKSVDIDGDYTETLARIDADKNGVGVFGLSFYQNNTDKLKVATMSGVVPSTETISSGEYPVSRPLYFYVKKAHIGVIPGLKEYIEFFVSDDMAGPDGPLAAYGLVSDPELAATQAAVAAETPMGPLE
jgi:phosphate transport system substrate-binding protein